MRPEPEEEEVEEKEMVIQNIDTAPPSQTATQGVRRNVQRAFPVETVEKHEIEDLDAKISQPPSPPPAVTRPRSIRRNVERTYLVEAEEKHETNDLDAKAAATRPKSVRRNVKRTYQAEGIEKRETNDLHLQNSQPPPSPPPMPARTKGVRRNANRTYQAETVEESEKNDLDLQNSQSPLCPPPAATRTKGMQQNARRERNDLVVKSSPPSPPPPPPFPVEVKTVEGKKKRGIATKEFLTSFRGKKKKQRQRSVENFDAILNSEPLVPEPPPPPPPPPKVFQNLFSLKKGKHKKSYIVSVAAATTTTSMTNKREHYSSYRVEDNVKMTGNESPLIPIPPPPPPPPFKLPAWKFRVQGDFVRVDSISSSRSGSPDLDDVGVDTPTSQCNSPFAKGGEECASVSAPSLFCPSPDVDTKAHNFIESFRAGLRMAKMNSMKERQGIGRSNLGPSQNHEWI